MDAHAPSLHAYSLAAALTLAPAVWLAAAPAAAAEGVRRDLRQGRGWCAWAGGPAAAALGVLRDWPVRPEESWSERVPLHEMGDRGRVPDDRAIASLRHCELAALSDGSAGTAGNAFCPRPAYWRL
ncbi:hypothetical protein DFH27DRAFT_606083 [Peziza echinospora]|nr:hypothetical protein DFH27DRAFT_606083 [Peziza echinospora]